MPLTATFCASFPALLSAAFCLRQCSRASVSTFIFLSSCRALRMECFQMPQRFSLRRFSLLGSVSVPSSSVASAISASLLASIARRSAILASQLLMSSPISRPSCARTWLASSCRECRSRATDCWCWMRSMRPGVRPEGPPTCMWMRRNSSCSLSDSSSSWFSCSSCRSWPEAPETSSSLLQVFVLAILQKQCDFHSQFVPVQPIFGINNASANSGGLRPADLRLRSNKNNSISYFLLFSMNSERNNERLKQIREKYGRPAKRNPDEDLRQLSHKRQVPPLQAQAHNNSPFSSYDAPLKPTRKDCKFDAQAFSRREKQNRPASPLSFINSPLARNFRQPQPPSPQLYDNALNYSEEFPRSQRPSLSENLHPCLSPRQSRPNVQDSSPIKKLQFQLEGQGTPRQLGNGIERYAAVTPHSAHSNRPLHPTDRSPACKPSPQQWQAEAIRRVPERAHMAPPRSEKAPQREECGEASSEEQAGKAFRLSSINNIQERIQWALAANKK